MGMTLWIHTLEGRALSKDSDDHSLMHSAADALDALSEAAGVRKLSEFFDFTDLEYNFAADADEDEDEAAVDAQTGYGYGIDDMQWFAAEAGLVTLRRLREDVAGGKLADLDEDYTAGLLEELDDCIAILEDSSQREGKFHLAVIE